MNFFFSYVQNSANDAKSSGGLRISIVRLGAIVVNLFPKNEENLR